LNKGHVYSVFIVDTAPPMPAPTPVQYRTSIRISFEDEPQRERPAACWQLWKEGRRISEAHKQCGNLQAVEYVEPRQSIEVDSRNTVNLDTASLDGFSVLWTPGTGGLAGCNVAVRFNFLSTDFSLSKGTRGVASRLCAKTEVVSTNSLPSSPEVPEICFCKVKLFRDHGAERKLSNDIVHVRKTIDKLKQQIAKVETGMMDFGRRKQSGLMATKVTRSSGQGKVPKHKRTWSMSSASPSEEDLHFKLQTMQDMLASARPVSVLCVRGEEQDDPDLHPIQLTGEPLDLTKGEPEEGAAWQQRTRGRSVSIAGSSTPMSPSPGPGLLQPQGIVHSGYEASAGAVLSTHGQRSGFQPIVPTGTELQQLNPKHLASPPDQLVGVQKLQHDSALTRWVEALEAESSSRPPQERPVKPGTFIFIHSKNFC
jgi:CP2 transcription factor